MDARFRPVRCSTDVCEYDVTTTVTSYFCHLLPGIIPCCFFPKDLICLQPPHLVKPFQPSPKRTPSLSLLNVLQSAVNTFIFCTLYL